MSAKQRQCAHCKQTGFLVGHGFAKGNGPTTSGQVIRGQRLVCSNRNQKQGCGRTTCVWLSSTLRRRSVFTATLSTLLRTGLEAPSRYAGWQAAQPMSISLRHCYRLWKILELSLSQIRTTLMRCCAPPSTTATETRPMAQLLDHLQHQCSGAAASHDVFAAFQLQFQQTTLRGSAAH
jgi:hypothetical protein